MAVVGRDLQERQVELGPHRYAYDFPLRGAEVVIDRLVAEGRQHFGTTEKGIGTVSPLRSRRSVVAAREDHHAVRRGTEAA